MCRVKIAAAAGSRCVSSLQGSAGARCALVRKGFDLADATLAPMQSLYKRVCEYVEYDERVRGAGWGGVDRIRGRPAAALGQCRLQQLPGSA